LEKNLLLLPDHNKVKQFGTSNTPVCIDSVTQADNHQHQPLVDFPRFSNGTGTVVQCHRFSRLPGTDSPWRCFMSWNFGDGRWQYSSQQNPSHTSIMHLGPLFHTPFSHARIINADGCSHVRCTTLLI